MLLKKTISLGLALSTCAVFLIFVYERITSLSGRPHATIFSKQHKIYAGTRKVVAQDDLHGKTISSTVQKTQSWDIRTSVSDASIRQPNYVISNAHNNLGDIAISPNAKQARSDARDSSKPESNAGSQSSDAIVRDEEPIKGITNSSHICVLSNLSVRETINITIT